MESVGSNLSLYDDEWSSDNPLWLFYIIAAERSGVSPHQLVVLFKMIYSKEFLVRNTYIYLRKHLCGIVTDIFKFTAEHMPRFNAISVSGYHMLEAGAPPH